jgi:deoxycytidylate deaminase
MQEGHCIRTVHSEANAILQAARSNENTDGCSLYVTASPCYNCFTLAAGAGIKRIVFGEFYRDVRIKEMAKATGIELVDMTLPDKCRECDSCLTEQGNCTCGALDDGCFNCSPDIHNRPPCPTDLLANMRKKWNWVASF